MRRGLVLAATAVMAALFPMRPSLPSSPSEGTLTLQQRTVAWTGSFTAAANVTVVQFGSQFCASPSAGTPHGVTSGPIACDAFALSVGLAPTYWTWPRDGGVSVVLDGFGADDDVDLSIHVRNPDGSVGPRVAGSSKAAGLAEKALIKEAAGDYYVFAIGFSVASSTYRGAATLMVQDGPAPGPGRAFDPLPMSRPLYGISAPDSDPARQRRIVEAADGADLYVDTWLPAAKNGTVPPAKIPTILIMTPYVSQGVPEYASAINYFVPRGYALAQHNVRGSGESGGCLEQTGPRQIDDGARVVEYLGRDAPWTDGTVGMYGISYDAETQISVAGLGDPAKTKYLKAIIPAASVGGQYEYSYFDGVPYLGYAMQSNLFYFGLVSAIPGATSSPQQYLEKIACQDEVLGASLDQSGDMTPYYQERELRPGASRIKAATLLVHGLADFNVLPLTAAGFFERLPASTPHKAIMGIWEHAFPDNHSIRPEWNRTDWMPVSLAWFDRYLKGLPTAVEDWPTVQVQGNDGQWRAEPDWPTTGGPVGHLALGPGGTLGVSAPTGATAYTEDAARLPAQALPGIAAFDTGLLSERLEITGQPVLDAWIMLDRPDAHVVAIIETFDAQGNAIVAGSDFGMRSMQHLDPLVDNRFVQTAGKPAPVGVPIRVPIRFLPTDLVVPKGGRLRLSISGSNWKRDEPTPSGAAATITILHDCEHTSALRFLTARAAPDLLRVRDVRPPAPHSDRAVAQPVSNAGGLVTKPVCGRAPERMAMFGLPIEQPGAPPPHRPAVVRGRRELPATGARGTDAGAILLIVAAAAAVALRPSRKV